jgi:UDP-2,3-diacylglucosamine pyrophosphatase LpxH
VRTLVVSDMHLGARLRRDVLRTPEALKALLDALDGVDRLVLLGDVVELLERRPQRAMEAAEPMLRAIGARLGPGSEVILVPGNHDVALVRPWLRAHPEMLTVDTRIPPDATPMLARIGAWLAPASVRVHYPGVWLSERVFATHGHYLDRHLLPESAYGIARGLLGRHPREGALPIDYELPGGPSLTRLEALLTRWLPRPLAALADDAAEYLRAATMPGIPTRLRSRRFAPLATMLLGLQMQRASIPADWVIFGHVHRAGPLPGDGPRRWRGPGGRPRIANTGAWTYEPLLIHRAAAPPHPYWPGGAIVLEDDGDPHVIGLLDHLDAEVLHGA